MTWEEERKAVYKLLLEVYRLDLKGEYVLDALDGIQCGIKNHLIKLNKAKKKEKE